MYAGWPVKFAHKIQGYSRIFLAKFKDISQRILSPQKKITKNSGFFGDQIKDLLQLGREQLRM